MERPKNPPRGTADLLPAEAEYWRQLEQKATDFLRCAGFGEIRTPIFEQTEIFTRATGESSDIVSKEMYTFLDRSDRSLTLRPEGTAAVARAYLTSGLDRAPKPVRLFYLGAMFRYERSQKGRFRQFHQLGVEMLGLGRLQSRSGQDFEGIKLAWDLFAALGVKDLSLQLNCLGDKASKESFSIELRSFLEAHQAEICPDCQRRLVTNPIRALDCKDPKDSALYRASAPRPSAFLGGEMKSDFLDLLALLGRAQIPYVVDDFLVRGLDYYTGNVFEIKALENASLATQNTICAGGRYDELLELFAGPATPAFGWALGLERLLELLDLPVLLVGALPRAHLVDMGADFVALEQVLCSLKAEGYAVTVDYNVSESVNLSKVKDDCLKRGVSLLCVLGAELQRFELRAR